MEQKAEGQRCASCPFKEKAEASEKEREELARLRAEVAKLREIVRYTWG